MSPLMRIIYEYVCSHSMRSYLDLQEHAHVTTCLTQLEEKLKASLQEEDRRAFQCCLDMAMELDSMETEAKFQAAFAAAKELA